MFYLNTLYTKLRNAIVTSLVSLDTDSYRRLNDTRAVRKNVSIPAWMATLADRQGVNCSQVLQEALRQKLGVSM